MEKTKGLMKVEDAARYLSVRAATVREWARQGKLPAVWLSSRALRFRQADLEAFIESRMGK